MGMTPAEKQKRYRQRLAAKKGASRAAPPVTPPPRIRRGHAPDGSPMAEPLVGGTVEELEAQIVRLKRWVAAADLDPAVTVRDKATVGSALTAALRLRARHRGEGEITESSVARSAPFRRAVSTIVAALKPYPDALRAVRGALAEIEAGS